VRKAAKNCFQAKGDSRRLMEQASKLPLEDSIPGPSLLKNIPAKMHCWHFI